MEAVRSAKTRFENEEKMEEMAYQMRLAREREEAEDSSAGEDF